MNNNVSFGAIHVGKASGFYKKGSFLAKKNVPVGINLYELEAKDRSFLEDYMSKFDYTKFDSKKRKDINKTHWKLLVDVCLGVVGKDSRFKEVLAVSQGKPCGILRYSKDAANPQTELDVLATWPIENKKDINGVGQALTTKVLADAISDGSSRVVLEVDKYLPGAKTFYEKLGFSSLKFDDGKPMSVMTLPKSEIPQALGSIKSKVSSQDVVGMPSVELSNIIK